MPQVEAHRQMLRAALADPLNERFVLLSESCVPLYPAATLYWQLLRERRSRVQSLGQDGRLGDDRYARTCKRGGAALPPASRSACKMPARQVHCSCDICAPDCQGIMHRQTLCTS